MTNELYGIRLRRIAISDMEVARLVRTTKTIAKVANEASVAAVASVVGKSSFRKTMTAAVAIDVEVKELDGCADEPAQKRLRGRVPSEVCHKPPGTLPKFLTA